MWRPGSDSLTGGIASVRRDPMIKHGDLFYQAVKSCPCLTRSLSLKSKCIVSKAVPAAEWFNACQMSRFVSEVHRVRHRFENSSSFVLICFFFSISLFPEATY